jgi:hypothetical protein
LRVFDHDGKVFALLVAELRDSLSEPLKRRTEGASRRQDGHPKLAPLGPDAWQANEDHRGSQQHNPEPQLPMAISLLCLRFHPCLLISAAPFVGPLAYAQPRCRGLNIRRLRYVLLGHGCFLPCVRA